MTSSSMRSIPELPSLPLPSEIEKTTPGNFENLSQANLMFLFLENRSRIWLQITRKHALWACRNTLQGPSKSTVGLLNTLQGLLENRHWRPPRHAVDTLHTRHWYSHHTRCELQVSSKYSTGTS